MNQRVILLFIAVVLLVSTRPAFGQRTIPMNIERIVADAGIILRGTVTDVSSRIDPATNLLSTFVTIDVAEDLYGAGAKQVVLKMLGGKTSKRTLKLADMPQYVKGQEIIGCFFTPSTSGFTSPVGMHQGTFTVITEPATGSKIIRTDGSHRRLFSGLKHAGALARADWTSPQNRTMDAAEFTGTLRSLISELK